MKNLETWMTRGLMIVILAMVVIAGFGQAVLQLWNWLMPEIFGLRPITFWQAVGLMALSWILFGGLRGSRGFNARWQRGWRHGMRERWEQMTPEQRIRFRQGLQGCWGRSDSPDATDNQ